VVGAGVAGHVVVAGPATTRGYLDNPKATEALFVDSAVRTGDIGYLDEGGWLYPLSRAKDVIIQAGRTVYPEEVEEFANVVGGVRYAAAIGVEHRHDQGEQVTILAEIRPNEMPDEAARKACVVAIVAGVHERFGFRPARVHLVEPKTITMTHNGKLRRAELKRSYLDGSLATHIVYPPNRSTGAP
jgi:acyl-CoA synthetase (AMP-forming)/AMP-acid ligase II